MKKFMFILAALAVSFIYADDDECCDSCGCGGNVYAGVFGGVNWVQKFHHRDPKTGFLVGGNVGYKWCNGLRAELEFSYRDNEVRGHDWESDNHTHLYAGLFNILYSFDSWGCWCLKPFIGAGVGGGSAKRHHTFCDPCHKSQSTFVWQLIAGLAYPLNNCVDIALTYRYFNTTNHTLHNHGLALGLGYNF